MFFSESQQETLRTSEKLFNPEFCFQIVSKSFQSIQTLLPKIIQIYQRLGEQQSSINTLENRVSKFEELNHNFTHQFRTINFSLEQKVNNTEFQFVNLANEFNLVKEQVVSLQKKYFRAPRKCDTMVGMNRKIIKVENETQYNIEGKIHKPERQNRMYFAKSQCKIKKPFISKVENETSIREIEDQKEIFQNQPLTEKSIKKSEIGRKTKKDLYRPSSKQVHYQQSKNPSISTIKSIVDSSRKINPSLKNLPNDQLQEEIQNQRKISKLLLQQILNYRTQFQVQIESTFNEIKSNLSKEQKQVQHQISKLFQQKFDQKEAKDKMAEIYKLIYIIQNEQRSLANKEETLKAIKYLDNKISSMQAHEFKQPDKSDTYLKIQKYNNLNLSQRQTVYLADNRSFEDIKQKADHFNTSPAKKLQRPTSSFHHREMYNTESRFNERYSSQKQTDKTRPCKEKQLKMANLQTIRTLKKKTYEALHNPPKIKRKIRNNMMMMLSS